MVVATLSSGGAERVATNLVDRWAQQGESVALITWSDSADDFYPVDSRVARLSLGLLQDSRSWLAAVLGNIRRIRRLRRMLRKLQPDVVVSFLSKVNITTILACWALPVRLVISERTHPPRVPLGAVWERLRVWTYPRADAVVALTRETAEWLGVHAGCKRVSVVPNAVFLPLAQVQPRVDPQAVVGAEKNVLLAVGRLVEEKGYDWLCKAFAEICTQHPDWTLVILGEGPSRDRLEALVAELGIAEHVSMPGLVGNVADWYARADLFVLSSRFEGFPSALIEAMASGCPCIGFDCDTGPRDLIEDGVNGRLVALGHVHELAAALSGLMLDPALRARFATRSEGVLERFSEQRIMADWQSVLSGSLPST
jgi:glycosyltransferase involved in cell wall biosynthesis